MLVVRVGGGEREGGWGGEVVSRMMIEMLLRLDKVLADLFFPSRRSAQVMTMMVLGVGRHEWFGLLSKRTIPPHVYMLFNRTSYIPPRYIYPKSCVHQSSSPWAIQEYSDGHDIE